MRCHSVSQSGGLSRQSNWVGPRIKNQGLTIKLREESLCQISVSYLKEVFRKNSLSNSGIEFPNAQARMKFTQLAWPHVVLLGCGRPALG